jgi:hypothetical protein
MGLSSIQDWIAWGGIVIPLFAMAWAAIFYVLTRRREVRFQEFERLFRVMDHLSQSDGSIPSKMAAAYELRKYPDYKEVIIRLCREAILSPGGNSEMLKSEMTRTAEFLEGISK